ncbi:hypothetical protein [Vibrio parahaemolyticus]|uniref:hypothetical protein n=1 Tax=Vibrio parahaemolyticus TaxID=670 RepID=UPI001A8E8B86|nr:hypothetical protein [Vibrio parahaemolyticus]MBO0180722.1 hypothetical protein [Vibrio parahaemolyticus]
MIINTIVIASNAEKSDIETRDNAQEKVDVEDMDVGTMKKAIDHVFLNGIKKI